jgi:hypothetical protein
MKKFFLVTLLLAVPTFGADSTPAPQRVVREFVVNNALQDWWLGGGWTWSDGTLTHWSGSGVAKVELLAMPPLTVGRTYGVYFNHSGSTKGTVMFSMGKDSSPAYTWRGTFPFALTVTDPDALLTLTPTSDYDGSISNIRMVELGDELVTGSTWTLDEGWTQDEDGFKHTSGAVASLTSNVSLIPGRSYRIYLSVSGVLEETDRKGGTVSLGGQTAHWFSGANFSYDWVASNDSPLVITATDGDGWFDGTIGKVSVREIVTDPVPSEPTQAP